MRSLVYEIEQLSLADFTNNGTALSPKAVFKLLGKMEWKVRFDVTYLQVSDGLVLTCRAVIFGDSGTVQEGFGVVHVPAVELVNLQKLLEQAQYFALNQALTIQMALNDFPVDMVYEYARLKEAKQRDNLVTATENVPEPFSTEDKVATTAKDVEAPPVDALQQKRDALPRKNDASKQLDKQTGYLFSLLQKHAMRSKKSIDELRALFLPIGDEFDTIKKRWKSMLISYLKLCSRSEWQDATRLIETAAVKYDVPLVRILEEVFGYFPDLENAEPLEVERLVKEIYLLG
ncbi:MAG: hypothetical protein ACPL3B_07355 [Fervidobacterium sp.]